MDTAVQDLPEVNMNEVMADHVQHGQPVQIAGAPTEGIVRMTMGKERIFLGIAHIDDDGRIAPKRLVVFRHQEAES